MSHTHTHVKCSGLPATFLTSNTSSIHVQGVWLFFTITPYTVNPQWETSHVAHQISIAQSKERKATFWHSGIPPSLPPTHHHELAPSPLTLLAEPGGQEYTHIMTHSLQNHLDPALKANMVDSCYIPAEPILRLFLHFTCEDK